MHSRRIKWVLCVFNSPTWRERRQMTGSLRCNHKLLRCGCNHYDRQRSCRSHPDRPPKLRWVRCSLDSGCCMYSSHIRPVLGGTNCKDIYPMRHWLDWETLSCFLNALFCPFSYYSFWRERFLLTNIYYGLLLIPIGKNLKVCIIQGHNMYISCGRRCRQRGYRYQMWYDGRGLVKGNRPRL